MDILRMKKILLLALIIGSCFSNTSYAGSLAGEEDGNPSHLSNYCWAFKFANGNVTANADGTCSIADAGGAGSGDNITVNSSAAADANFLNGDIDWTLNGASTPDDITATVACTGCIDATDMAADSVGESELIESMNFVATGGWDHGGGTLEVPNSTSLPGTCTVGQIYMDTDATSGQRIYACQATNTWALQGDGGGGGSGDITAVGSMTTGDAFADATADDDWLGLGVAAGRIEFDDQTNDEVNIISPLVGINTSTPSAPLHIYSSGSANETVAGFKIQRSDTTNITHLQHYFAGISYLSNNLYRDVSSVWDLDLDTDTGVALILDSRASQGYFAVYTAPATVGALSPTERFRVTNAGRVGIGTSGPDVDLDVNNASGGALQLTYNDSNGGAATYAKFQVNSSGHLAITPSGSGISVTDDDWLGLGSAAGRIEFDDQTTDEVNILNARLGVETSTPAYSLQVGTGTITVGGYGGGTNALVKQLLSDTTTGKYVQLAIQGPTNGGGAVQFYNGSGTAVADFGANYTAGEIGFVNRITSGYISFWTTNSAATIAEKMRMTGEGKLGIGTTAPDVDVDINNASGGSLQLTYNDSNGSAANKVVMQTSSTGDLTITPSGGDVTSTGTILSSSTGSLGWSIVSAANQACTTTCTSAAVFGWDTTSGEVAVSASDATADKCLCAGAS